MRPSESTDSEQTQVEIKNKGVQLEDLCFQKQRAKEKAKRKKRKKGGRGQREKKEKKCSNGTGGHQTDRPACQRHLSSIPSVFTSASGELQLSVNVSISIHVSSEAVPVEQC